MKIRRLCLIILFATLIYPLDVSYARSNIENLSQVEKLFMEGRYERVVAESTRLIDIGSHGREELFYLKGLSLMQLSRFREARDTFSYMIERYPTGKRTFDGYVGIGDAYFLEGKVTEAVAAYNNALKEFPGHKNSSFVKEKLKEANQKIGNSAPVQYFAPVKKEIQPQKEAQPIQQSSDEGSYYYVQAGYFKNKDNAEKLNEKLKAKGYNSYLSTQTKFGAVFYRVKVGAFKVKSEAEIMARKLKSDGYKTKVCR